MTSIRKTAERAVAQVKQKVEQNPVGKALVENPNLIKGGVATALNTSKALTFAKDGMAQARKLGTLISPEGILGKAGREFISNPKLEQGGFGALKSLTTKAAGAMRFAGVATAGMAAFTAVKDIRQAVASHSRDDITKAVRSTLDAGKAGLSAVTGGLQGSKVAGGLLHGTVLAEKAKAGKAAFNAFRTALPHMGEAAAKAAGNAALKGIMEGASRPVLKGAIETAAKAAATKGGATLARAVVGSGGRAAAKAALNAGTKAASRAALAAGTRAATGAAAKAAARFAPGLNVAMAAVDTANAVATLADRNAGPGKKITSVITAAGSIAAATNIPIVSQVGAAVSVVSGIVGSFFR